MEVDDLHRGLTCAPVCCTAPTGKLTRPDLQCCRCSSRLTKYLRDLSLIRKRFGVENVVYFLQVSGRYFPRHIKRTEDPGKCGSPSIAKAQDAVWCHVARGFHDRCRVRRGDGAGAATGGRDWICGWSQCLWPRAHKASDGCFSINRTRVWRAGTCRGRRRIRRYRKRAVGSRCDQY